MPVEVRYYTDPACPWSWGTEPKVRRLMWEFGDELRFSWVMGGLAHQYGPDHPNREPGTGWIVSLMAEWLDAADESGMPVDARLWTTNPIASSYPACQAAKAAGEQGPDAAYRYLRRLREGLMTERRKLDHPEALIGEAGAAGLDTERFRIDLSSNAITEAFAANLDEVRNPPSEARDVGMVERGERGERVSFPSALFRGEDGSRRGVWGWSPYAAYREAAIATGAEPREEREPEIVEALERFGRCLGRELEELTRKARPVLEAELWELAREWRLKAVAVAWGTAWELP
jgi:predicted DsbA family dithiol-disulfide isomerase